MTGKFVNEKVHEENSNNNHARWYLELLDIPTQKLIKIYYHDQRNFGTLKFCLSKTQFHKKLESLGPDILNTTQTTVETFINLIKIQKPDLNICKFLMNQAVSFLIHMMF